MDLPDARVLGQSSITTLIFSNVEVASSSNMILQVIDGRFEDQEERERRVFILTH